MLEFFYFFYFRYFQDNCSYYNGSLSWVGVEMSFKVLWFELYINDDKRL